MGRPRKPPAKKPVIKRNKRPTKAAAKKPVLGHGRFVPRGVAVHHGFAAAAAAAPAPAAAAAANPAASQGGYVAWAIHHGVIGGDY
jgi:hypothetical protein